MNWFESILNSLNGQMQRPQPFGWFHILWLVVMVALCAVAIIFGKRANEKQNKIILIVASCVLILFEIYKQLNFSYNPSTDKWDYQWYAFPWQFCSTPMFVMLLAGVLGEGKFRNALYEFLATFALFGGLITMILPDSCFTSTIGINIQTMLHHSTMVVIGVYLWASGRAKLQEKRFLSGSLVFISLAGIALLLNIISYKTGITGGETFNMFFISPYFQCTLIILDNIYKTLPYPVFLLIYLLGFMLCAYIVYNVVRLVYVIKNAILNAKKVKQEIQTDNVSVENENEIEDDDLKTKGV